MRHRDTATDVCARHSVASPWTVAHQAPLSLGFFRQEYWSELPFPSPGDLPYPGVEPGSPPLQADSLPSEQIGKSISVCSCSLTDPQRPVYLMGINLLSHHIVNNTFSQLGEDHSQKVPFLTMWLLMKSREGFPVTGLEGSPTVHP